MGSGSGAISCSGRIVCTSTTTLLLSMKIMSNGMRVFFIQKPQDLFLLEDE